MERTLKGIYTPEFQAEAVKLVEATGMSVRRAAKRLSMPKSSLDCAHAYQKLLRQFGMQAINESQGQLLGQRADGKLLGFFED